MTITHHNDIIQGSDEWHALRCGMLTASEMKHILTPATLKYASNDKERSHVYELAAQRITGYVEPHYISDDMLRGHEDEVEAKIAYAEHYAPVDDIGFITNDQWGFTLGFSPDGLVGDDGLIECKSRRQKFQVETILGGVMPDDYRLQVQTALLVSGRKWCDFISYCGGMPMFTVRVYPDFTVQEAIIQAATKFNERVTEKVADFLRLRTNSDIRLIPTERRVEQDIMLTTEE